MKVLKMLWLPALVIACSHEAPADEWQCDNRTTGLGSWSPTALPMAEVGNTYTAHAWTGSELVVWGGLGIHEITSCVPCGGGAIFDPQANRWSTMSTDGAPTARGGVPGVWTGERFIVWGGRRKNWQTLSSAGATVFTYDPASDTWGAFETRDPPEWRTRHLAVWTGEEMLIWGGASEDSGNTYFRNGAALDLDERRWRRISNEGAPEGMVNLPTIWTGSELIVWGGWAGELRGTRRAVATGAIYDVASDTWRPMSTVGAPSARVGHLGVWTGEEMLIYGGGEFQAGLRRDGFAYNPESDTWRKLSTKGAPGEGDSAVWTGTEMIVWGGRLDCYIGSRYDPANDVWRPMTPVNAPFNRSGSIGVWTGESMIVYGGVYGPEGRLDTVTGGIYFP